ncbi:cytochrome-c oxidase, cbb3-type subunit III [Hyphobacterium sp. HN65]|uniref:Cbb3-type cytochrome c oxidase subunit n=1 Tax=Hyphobacterium lacteum TaxID=3116575 RepID=A0ABU7LRJ6_9PROT|nr:cytochrome-c oxidase, cbb3-type subunit III [Hyphobacterium sp. HN65]MEE2526523.1 cytochrome-c oxidase, cbb3-type subunit III [Hyphobacterium sp. HN65]
MSEKDIDQETGTETTGHEWDGIKELDNPLPRWWLWIFYACIAWSVVYWVLMPAWPAPPGMQGNTTGITGNSERVNVAADMDALQASRSELYGQLQAANGYSAIEADPVLFRFALAAGDSAFGNFCATCHGAGAQGFTGYPNLNDDEWLWGGSFDDIRHTLLVGIRSDHPDTRFSQMPAYGEDGLLTREQINHVRDYVLNLSGETGFDAAALEEGGEIFASQCSTCHGVSGTGDRSQGAPDLTDHIWLYGGSPEQVAATIYRGPYGVMPAWEGRLDDPTITALATYVYSLGGGESAEGGAAGE